MRLCLSLLVIAAFLATGCLSSGPKGVESLSEDFTIIEGPDGPLMAPGALSRVES